MYWTLIGDHARLGYVECRQLAGIVVGLRRVFVAGDLNELAAEGRKIGSSVRAVIGCVLSNVVLGTGTGLHERITLSAHDAATNIDLCRIGLLLCHCQHRRGEHDSGNCDTSHHRHAPWLHRELDSAKATGLSGKARVWPVTQGVYNGLGQSLDSRRRSA